MLHALVLTVEAAGFAVGLVAVLGLIGLPIAQIALPSGELQLLLAPPVGLAVLMLGFQWLTFFVPPHVAAVVVVVAGLTVAAWMVWRRRAVVWEARHDLAGAASVALLLFLALLQIDIQRGFFTLGGWPSDNIFIYTQAAQYLADHAAPSVLHAAAFANPGTDYLTTTGRAFPNSVGSLDSALSALTRQPVYAVFDSLNAVALAMSIGPLWVFVRRCLAASWTAAFAAALVFATNQLIYWVIGLGFQQECIALPIFTTGLVVAALVARAPTFRGGALLGVLVAALAGVYLPVAGLLVLCLLACAAVTAMMRGAAGVAPLLRSALAAAVAFLAAGVPALYVLLFGSGLAIWTSDLGQRLPVAGVSRFPFLPYIVGALPFAHGWEAGRLPYGTLDQLSFPLYWLATALIAVLLVIGIVRAVRAGRGPETALLAAGLMFAVYEGVIAQYPYGFVKSIGYLAPMTSAFIAFGALGTTLARTNLRGQLRLAGLVSIGLLVLASGLASRDMVDLWITAPGLPTLPPSYIAFSAFSSSVPQGSSVLIDQPQTDYHTLVEVAAIAYFLPDRNVRVPYGESGTSRDQNLYPRDCAFQFVIAQDAPGTGFTAVYTDAGSSYTVYRRDGPACST